MVDDAQLGRLVKVNQDVAAKNYVKVSHAAVVLKVVVVKADRVHQVLVGLVAVGSLGEETLQVLVGNSADAGVGIKALLSDHQGL